jgi:Leucine-rich repeat (LRR) protein
LVEPAWTHDTEAALAEAERRIEDSGQGWWYGERPYVTALDRLPRNIGKLTSKTVDISATAVSDIAGVASKPNIEQLVLNDRVTDLSVVAELSSLDRLVAYKAPIRDVSAIRACTSLRTLLLNAEHVADLSPLAELPNLARLELWRYRGQPLWPGSGIRQLVILGATPRSADLAPLRTWARLELLSCDGRAIAGELPVLPSVTVLIIAECDDHAFASLAGYSALETLHAHGGPLSDLTPLAPCMQLEAVSVSRTRISSIEPLLDKSLLTFVSVDDTAVSEIAGLSWLPQMRHLRAARTAVRDLSGWNPDASLRSLALTGTPLISLDGFRSGRLLALEIGGTGISDLSFVAGVPSLLTLDFSGTEVADLGPALAHPSLLGDASHYDYRDYAPSVNFADTPVARSHGALLAISEIADSRKRQAALRRHFGLSG